MLEIAPGNYRTLGVKDVAAAAFITKSAQLLKESLGFEKPQWMDLVKSGASKELSPYDADFIFIRASAILRKLAVKGPRGVGLLRREFGKVKNNGVAPSHCSKASGKIIRYCLQELQRLNFIEMVNNKDVRGLSSKGRAFADQVAKEA